MELRHWTAQDSGATVSLLRARDALAECKFHSVVDRLSLRTLFARAMVGTTFAEGRQG
jgi:hypothetical protein